MPSGSYPPEGTAWAPACGVGATAQVSEGGRTSRRWEGKGAPVPEAPPGRPPSLGWHQTGHGRYSQGRPGSTIAGHFGDTPSSNDQGHADALSDHNNREGDGGGAYWGDTPSPPGCEDPGAKGAKA